MIYDCFPFFNELDLLEIRLNYLDEVVDKFVLVEMGKTASGKDKPFFFDENKERYSKFLDKIIHIKVSDYPDENGEPDYSKPWLLENYQRDCIMRGLKDAKSDDIILISDLDEIPAKKVVKEYTSGIISPVHKMMYYYLNNLNVTNSNWVKGTKICHYSDLIDPQIDIPKQLENQYTKKGLPTYIRFYSGNLIFDGGWHFSYLGGAKAISYKIKSFAHQELNKEDFTNEAKIEKCVKKGEDIFGRGDRYRAIPIDETFPDYIVENQEKYQHLILKTKI